MRCTLHTLALSTGILAAHLLGACGDATQAPECAVSRDCPDGSFCIAGTCRAPEDTGTGGDADAPAEDVGLPEADGPLPDTEVVATDQFGGNGAAGRIRIDSPSFTASGTVDPFPGVLNASTATCP